MDGPAGRLGGIRTLPAKPVTNAVALLIPGSGPTDRDGNGGPGLRTNAYRMLAEALAERGVGSLRIDKRGMYSSSEGGDPNAVTLEAYAQDVGAWAGTLASPCVVPVGHSEGGVVALKVALGPPGSDALDVKDPCAVVLLAAPGRPLGDILREQLGSNPLNRIVLGDGLQDAIAALEAGERVDTTGMNDTMLSLFRDEVQGYWIDLMAFDPAGAAQAVDVPLMVVGGGRDTQVTRADYDGLSPHADTALWLADMTHVLKGADGRVSALRTYSDPEAQLAEGLADAVAAFVVEAGD